MEIKEKVCPVCGFENMPTDNRVYTARQDIAEGVAAAFSSREPELYDVMDCTFCGCQIKLARRLRPYVENKTGCCGECDA